ncbi:hypothetical protein TVAG_035410 [Trichomonas vaginalis G3]|uniref:Uncharacterized protein n=2 Tax=Trichomonas vaginalis TaxID=5722 RepID=A2DAL5_TRIV3|nr:endoribonuclease L-PSP family [Trichomonas vaginalis G3]7KGC_A Chain A, Putative translation initiation inhibitor [Trichomonas vaginalis]7KGC_B Chain B, Putative translation initiation inhibitor [Trichomonas vaginalis]7KGC_C Chain C, Putative translation initiation inhibitor [Trichomonas vaginalis]7KGC_D Chain D, Putative translation initiation inhibitor [Trichomonas vaginalis]AFH78190.1 putative translation initiation inhibitor [Trichomonas vaginalis]EAY22518.1 hypothetical protein TVAG_0|eukprot:XP_001583504.1 hypothetical protein [Trichomonas vaginalis G3]
MSKVISTPDAPAAIGPYCQARLCDRTLYTSGIIGNDPHGGPNPETVEGQAELIMKSLDAMLKAAGYEKTDVVKCNCYLADIADFQKFNKIYADYFGDHKPCRCCIQAGKLPAGKLVELDAIAYK